MQPAIVELKRPPFAKITTYNMVDMSDRVRYLGGLIDTLGNLAADLYCDGDEAYSEQLMKTVMAMKSEHDFLKEIPVIHMEAAHEIN